LHALGRIAMGEPGKVDTTRAINFGVLAQAGG
jgi:hypothetical protein